MSDSYYSLEEASQKLGKSAEELRELAKVNGISELRDGSNILYKKEDIDALEGGSVDGDSAIGEIGSAEESILELASLDDEESLDFDDDMEKMIELSDADTAIEMDAMDEADSGVSDDSLLSLADTMDTDSDIEPAKAPAPAADEVTIDADADLGTAEEGSGILDLSLQADDSQLGVVLDGILPSGDNDFGDLGDFDIGFDDAAKPSADELDVSEPEEDQLAPVEDELDYEEPEPAAMPQAMPAGIPAVAMAQAGEEGTAFGFAMLLPLVSVVMITLVLLNISFNGAEPVFMPFARQYFIYIAGGIALLTLIISIVGAAGGAGSGAAKPKNAKNAKGKKGAKQQKKAKGKKKK